LLAAFGEISKFACNIDLPHKQPLRQPRNRYTSDYIIISTLEAIVVYDLNMRNTASTSADQLYFQWISCR